MMKRIFTVWIALCAICAVQTASAQLVAVKWGVLAGLNVSDYSFKDERVDIENKLGWQAGLTASVKVAFLTIDPQLLYIRQTLDLNVPSLKGSAKLKTQSIDLPVTVGVTLFGPLRLFAGPVFTIMNKCDGNLPFADERDFDLTNLRSTLSYTVGAELRLFKRVRLDLRYNGQFKDKKDVALSSELIGKMRSQSISMNLGYYF